MRAARGGAQRLPEGWQGGLLKALRGPWDSLSSGGRGSSPRKTQRPRQTTHLSGVWSPSGGWGSQGVLGLVRRSLAFASRACHARALCPALMKPFCTEIARGTLPLGFPPHLGTSPFIDDSHLRLLISLEPRVESNKAWTLVWKMTACASHATNNYQLLNAKYSVLTTSYQLLNTLLVPLSRGCPHGLAA